MTCAFPLEEYETRLERLRAAMAVQEVDVAIVHTPESLCYLTGHATPGYYVYQCLLVPAEGPVVLLTRETETVNAREMTYLERIVGYPDAVDPIDATVEAVRGLGGEVRRLGLEESSWFCSPLQHRRLAASFPGAAVVPIDQAVAQLRLIKSPLEISALRIAARTTNATIDSAARAVHVGATEREVAAEAFASLVREGSEFLGMEPFVASGPRSGAIHASWTDRRIESGEPVLIELAASHSRYHAALMHTVWIGKLSPRLSAMAEACEEARAAAVATVRPGRTPAEAHEACRQAIGRRGLLDTYRKRTGYSIGIAFAPDWGEGHILSLKETEHRPFEPGMVVHVVPALRIAGEGGIGQSATILVTEGDAEVLTRASVGPVLSA